MGRGCRGGKWLLLCPFPPSSPRPRERWGGRKTLREQLRVAEREQQAGPGKGEGPAPHQPSTQSREGSPLESSSCPWRTEGRVPATAARRLPAAAFRWKLVAPQPRGAGAAAISAAGSLTGARGRREESSPFLATNGRAAWERRCPMGERVVCTSRAKGAGKGWGGR